MKEVEIRGQRYRIGKLNAFKQMLIVKRLATVLGPLQAIAGNFDQERPEMALDALGEAIGALPDESATFISQTCLSACKRKESGGGWAPVFSDGQLMYEDTDLLTMLALTGHCLAVNLMPFFQGVPSLAPAGGKTGKA